MTIGRIGDLPPFTSDVFSFFFFFFFFFFFLFFLLQWWFFFSCCFFCFFSRAFFFPVFFWACSAAFLYFCLSVWLRFGTIDAFFGFSVVDPNKENAPRHSKIHKIAKIIFFFFFYNLE